MQYEWMLVGALGNVIARGVEPAMYMAFMRASIAKGVRDDCRIVISEVEDASVTA